MIGRHERVKRDEAEWQGLKRSKKLEGVSSRDGKQGLGAASKCYFTEWENNDGTDEGKSKEQGKEQSKVA